MRLKYILSTLFILISVGLKGQIVYPVTLNTTLNSNGSVYLSDYTDDALQLLKLTLTFNDASEPSWDVRLKMTIESSTIKLQSKPIGNYSPITLYPNQPFQLSGSQLYEYFDYNNLESQGISLNQLSNNGRLPEGTYVFNFEVLDYNSGKAISTKSYNLTYVVLYDPPIIQSPQNEITIVPQNTQNIVFQWQDGTPPTYGSTQNTEYTLHLYEITNNQISPKAALSSNQVLQIYTSTPQSTTTLIYDASLPTLDENKRYIFTIHAEDINGRDVFKNNGISEPSWFSYGYATGGTISLTSPPANDAFTKKQQKLFEWSVPSNLSIGQNYNYQYVITKINSGQTAEQAISNNLPLHTEITNSTTSQSGWSYILQDEMEGSQDYAWQIKAYSGTTEIATSPVQKIKGPPFMEKFLAGSHEVIVRQTYNNDLNNFAGNGDVKINGAGDVVNIDFTNIKLNKSGDRYIMIAGEIATKINSKEITLTPYLSDNGNAIFKMDSLKLNSNRLAVSGTVEWDFPLAVIPSSSDKVQSKYTWFNFDNYYLNGSAIIKPNSSFELANPINFTMTFNKNTNFIITKNKYILKFKGNIILPSSLHAHNENANLALPFETDQLFYFENNDCKMNNKIRFIKGLNIETSPSKVVFDFSDDKSPYKLASNTSWRGVYVCNFNVTFNQEIDSTQLKLRADYTNANNTNNNNEFWIESQGLHLIYQSNFRTNMQLEFNTFGGVCKKIALNIDDNQVSSSVFEGAIEVYIISSSQLFDFEIPITEHGFQQGDLKTPLDGQSITINSNNPDKKIDININNAHFANNSHLNMNIDLEWAKQNITITSIPDFCVWGNAVIGFKSPNSMMALPNQLTTNMDGGFEITIDSIGAGMVRNAYALVFISTASLGKDISGKNGPPKLHFVSDETPNLRSSTSNTRGMGDLNNITDPVSPNVAPVTSMISDHIDLGLKSTESGVLLHPYIKVNAVVAKMEGHLSIFYNHPDWGDGFHGYLYGNIMLPISKSLFSHMVFGVYQNEVYWFLSVAFDISERGSTMGSNFTSKVPEGSGMMFKSKKLGKLTGANVVKVGIPLGPVTITGIEGRIYHHMSHSIGNTVIGENGYTEFDYRPNPNVDFGFLLRTSFIDTYTQGANVMYTGAFETTFGGGQGLRTIGLEGRIGIGNLKLPGGLIDASVLEGDAVITLDFADKHYIGSAEVNTGLPTLCGHGTLDIDVNKDKFEMKLGSEDDHVYFVPGCIGYSLEGWMDVTKQSLFLGAGVRAQIELQSPWIGVGDLASIKPYAGFYLATGFHTKLRWDPKFELNDIGIWVQTNAGVYCKYKYLGSEGEWTLGRISLNGDFNLHFLPTPIKTTGVLRGSVELLSIDVNFDLNGSYTFL